MRPERRFIVLVSVVGCLLMAWSLRFSEPEFRAWERVLPKNAFVFDSNRRVEGEEIGDLGYRTWIRALQRPRHVTFTTDSRGFRNPREMASAPVVVIGDSYVVGTGVSDEETLPQRLSARLGVSVYNYGQGIGGTPQLFLADDRFQRAPPRVVVYAPVQRLLRPRPLLLPGNRWPEPKSPHGAIEHWRALGESVQDMFTHLNRDNGLAVAARFAFNGLRYRLFGLPGTAVVDGKVVLLLSIEEQYLEVPVRERAPVEVVQTIVMFNELLAKRGIRLLFCPLFELATIYPDLYPAEEQARVQHPSMLDVVIPAARRGGVATLDLRPLFTQRRVPYLYLSDDSHLGPPGLDLAADALAQAVRALASSPGPPQAPDATGL